MSEPTEAFTETRRFKVMRTVVGAGNPLMRRLLDSRFAGPMAKQLLLLRYRGNKSGRTITTPVGDVRDGDRVVLVTSPSYRWWPNFTGGADAELRLPEGWRAARLEVLAPEDPRFEEAVALQVRQRGAGMLRGFGLAVDEQGRLGPEARAAAQGTALIVLGVLEPPAAPR
jgi:hypothetical protein